MKQLFAAILVLACGSASPALAGDYYTKYKNEDKKLGQPSEDRALVYFIRPAKMGAAIKTWAFSDDEFVGVARSSGYFFGHVPPGKRTFWAKAENVSVHDLEVEAGETYYFKLKLLPGIAKARVKLVPLDDAQAAKLLKKCGYTEPTEEGRRRAAEIVGERLDRVEQKAARKAARSDG